MYCNVISRNLARQLSAVSGRGTRPIPPPHLPFEKYYEVAKIDFKPSAGGEDIPSQYQQG